jgi:tetratricopeptide (TPR) repeat protein
MVFNKRVFFTLFPKGYWILLAVGIALHFIEITSKLGNILINFGSFLVAIKVAVILHETGHLLAAKAVGGVPRRMVLGNGHELYRTKIFDIIMVINSNFLGGYACASIDQPKFLRMRYGFFILGGVLLNLIVALAFYAFSILELNNPNDEVSVRIFSTIFLANAIIMFIALIPYYVSISGTKVPTDGLAMLRLPFIQTKEVKEQLDVNLLFDGHEFLEIKEYSSAWNTFQEYLSKYPDSKIHTITLSYILLKTGQPEKSIEECQKLLNNIHDDQIKPYSAVIYNQLAWAYLVLNNIEQADYFSALAIKTVPKENHFRATRGSVLIEIGSTHKGMSLLFHNMDFQFINNATLSAAIYLMLAYHSKGEIKESDKYLQFVKRNEDKLDADEKILFQRNLAKMGANKEVESRYLISGS